MMKRVLFLLITFILIPWDTWSQTPGDLCQPPTNITVVDISTDSATITWTRGGTETAWELAVGNRVFYLNDTFYTVHYLDSNTTYNITVRAICDDGDTSIAASGIFHTPCFFLRSLPYYNDFESEPHYSIGGTSRWDAFPECWTRINDGTSNAYYPHITNEIKSRVFRVGNNDNADFVITEIGGTVGDIESLPFLEAIRQVKKDVGKNDVLYIHVTLVPYIGAAGELKTKPTQHSVKELRSIGITPDILVCRSEHPMSEDMIAKLAMFCDVDKEAVIQNLTAKSIYQVPQLLEEQHMDDIVLQKLDMPLKPKDMSGWHDMVARILKHYDRKVTIAVAGKYVELQDAYISITESLKHAALHNEAELDIRWVNAEKIEAPGTDLDKVFEGVDGILVPGGFGDRGIEGKISAVRYAREHKIPFFGICLGMQCAVIEFARNICGMQDANSSEFKAEVPAVIDLMPDQVDIEDKGGTMRLGLYPCKVYPDTLTDKAYGQPLVYERHRHRYEFNNEYRDVLTKNGLVLGGISPDNRLVEIVELPQSEHPWFLGCQFHPEFKSRPTKAHPLFRDFIAAALQYGK